MRAVTCDTEGCSNADIPIEVPDDNSLVMCGPCGAILAEPAPEPVESPAEGDTGDPDEPEETA